MYRLGFAWSCRLWCCLAVRQLDDLGSVHYGVPALVPSLALLPTSSPSLQHFNCRRFPTARDTAGRPIKPTVELALAVSSFTPTPPSHHLWTRSITANFALLNHFPSYPHLLALLRQAIRFTKRHRSALVAKLPVSPVLHAVLLCNFVTRLIATQSFWPTSGHGRF